MSYDDTSSLGLRDTSEAGTEGYYREGVILGSRCSYGHSLVGCRAPAGF